MTRTVLAAALLATSALAAAPARAGVCQISGTSCYTQYNQSFSGQVERIVYASDGIAYAEIREDSGILWRVGGAQDFSGPLAAAQESGAVVTFDMVGADADYLTVEAPLRSAEILSTIEVLFWDVWDWSIPAYTVY